MAKKISLWGLLLIITCPSKFCYPMEHIKDLFSTTITKLHNAITKQNTKKVKKILEKNLDLNTNIYRVTKNKRFKKLAKKQYGKTCKKAYVPLLVIAAGRSNLEIMQLLLQRSSNKNPTVKLKIQDKIISLQVTPYLTALASKNMDIADYLLRYEQLEKHRQTFAMRSRASRPRSKTI